MPETPFLVLSAEPINHGYLVRVHSQERRNFPSFKATNGVTISSASNPEVVCGSMDSAPGYGTRQGSVEVLYVRGSMTAEDNRGLFVTSTNLARIKAAVAEFNAKMTPPSAPSAPLPNGAVLVK